MINRVRTNRIFHCYINPRKEVSVEAVKVHGITNAFLNDKPVFEEVVDDFLSFVEDSTLIIHNAAFDMSFINNELTLTNKPSIGLHRVVDSLLMARKKFPGAPASLDALCKRFNISLEKRDKHGALLDAELLTHVYLNLIDSLQATINLDMHANGNDEMINPSSRQVRPARVLYDTAADNLKHKEFLTNNIPDAIWNKVGKK